jgi:hypothetical protein
MLVRLIVVAIILAEKCYDDEENSFKNYSLVSGVPIKELILLESRLV